MPTHTHTHTVAYTDTQKQGHPVRSRSIPSPVPEPWSHEISCAENLFEYISQFIWLDWLSNTALNRAQIIHLCGKLCCFISKRNANRKKGRAQLSGVSCWSLSLVVYEIVFSAGQNNYRAESTEKGGTSCEFPRLWCPSVPLGWAQK